MNNTATETPKLIRKVHECSGAKLITLHPELCRKFNIDSLTFMEEVATEEGILLKPRRLTA